MEPTKVPKPLHVTVVADNPGTVGDLHEYLTGAGIVVDPSRRLRAVSELPEGVAAVVIFPDDYDAAKVVAGVTALRAARPGLLILLVTSAPHRLGAALDPDGRTMPPLLLPKPAFGWSILDVIRAHAAAQSEAD